VRNYRTHKHPKVKAWLTQNPRVTLTSPRPAARGSTSSRSLLDHRPQAIRRGTFNSVTDLTAKIGHFIDGCNERCQPFVWTKTADELLTRIKKRRETSRAGH
jgi:hypothetical protein